MGRMHVDLAMSYRPRCIVGVDILETRLAKARQLYAGRAQKEGIAVHWVNGATTDVPTFISDLTEAVGGDDVIVAVGSAGGHPAGPGRDRPGRVLNLFGGLKKGEDVLPFDTGLSTTRKSSSRAPAAACPGHGPYPGADGTEADRPCIAHHPYRRSGTRYRHHQPDPQTRD